MGGADGSPPQHQLGVLVLDVLVHQLQQQRPHDVRVVLHLAVQRHRQEGGEVAASARVEVRPALQGVDELMTDQRIN